MLDELGLASLSALYTDTNRPFNQDQYETIRMNVVSRSVQFRDTYRIYKAVGYAG